ncbi:hypothetical protein HY498_05195 [Candidatus Woesearchaeota archaeon]|nr:hypothetical protein [Candidatus Woesearchaeota archaeon]
MNKFFLSFLLIILVLGVISCKAEKKMEGVEKAETKMETKTTTPSANELDLGDISLETEDLEGISDEDLNLDF